MERRTGDLQALPTDVLREILLRERGVSALALCRTSRQFRELCRDRALWEAKLRADYPGFELVPEADPALAYRLIVGYKQARAALRRDDVMVELSGIAFTKMRPSVMNAVAGIVMSVSYNPNPGCEGGIPESVGILPLILHRTESAKFLGSVNVPAWREEGDMFLHRTLLHLDKLPTPLPEGPRALTLYGEPLIRYRLGSAVEDIAAELSDAESEYEELEGDESADDDSQDDEPPRRRSGREILAEELEMSNPIAGRFICTSEAPVVTYYD